MKWRLKSALLTHLEVVEAGLDAGRVLSIRLNVLAEQLASRDALPFEVLGEGLEVLLTVCTGSAQEEDAAN